MRTLDAFLPAYEYSERHRVAVDAAPERIDRALREVTFGEVPAVRALVALRGLGRPAARRSVLDAMTGRGVLLEDAPGTGVVLGLTGQFWRLRGGDPAARCRTPAEFEAFAREDACKAIIDFRIDPPGVLSTETRVHVGDPRARRSFGRYWRVIRPFSGLIRILVLRAVKRRAEAGR